MTITSAALTRAPLRWTARFRSRRASASGLAAVALSICVSACGSAASTTRTSSTNDSPSSAPAPNPEAYTDCMRSHGVHDFPNPVDGHITLTPSSGINPASPQFQAASTACASLGPAGSQLSSPSSGGHASTRATPVSAAQWRAFGEWLAQRSAAGQFSGAVLVARDGKPLLEAGYGMADRHARVPNTPQTKFCIASIGKLFTAVAIAQLVEQHKLAFNAKVGRYVAGLPAAIAEHVTIAQLLTMTSGLGNVALGRPHPPTTLAGMIKLIAKEQPQFKPGSRFSYSNDGYILLGAIIENVTGQSYAGYLRRHIFKPAGMTQTDVNVYTPARIAGMAHGYVLVGPNGQPVASGAPPATGRSSGPTKLDDNSAMPQLANPSGGAYSTVGDLLKFAQALLDHKLLTPAMTRTILIPRVNSPQPGGPPVDKYTYGFAYQAINGVSFVGHNGGTPGYEGQIDIYPRTGYVVIILTNQDQVLVPAIQRTETILTSL